MLFYKSKEAAGEKLCRWRDKDVVWKKESRKGIKFRFPIFYNGVETDQLDFESCWDKETNDETVVLMSKVK